MNEARVFKSWVKSLARRGRAVRSTGFLDSRVTIGAAAKGRSSSYAISRVLQGCFRGTSLVQGFTIASCTVTRRTTLLDGFSEVAARRGRE